MHFHKWTEWKLGSYQVVSIIKGHRINGVQEVQERKCTKCGKTQRSYLL